MKRSLRRHQQLVEKARRVRILLRHGAWTPSSYWQPKIWQPLCRLVMSEPGWWVHERVILPARTTTHRGPACGRPYLAWLSRFRFERIDFQHSIDANPLRHVIRDLVHAELAIPLRRRLALIVECLRVCTVLQ
jgi:hypothetical protein